MRIHAFLVSLVFVAAGCQSNPKTATAPVPPAPASVTIHASDYAFVAPDTIASGVTTIHLINDGPGLHHALLVRLDSGKSVADLLVVLKQHQPLPAWATFVGGPNVPEPGTESVATLDLVPGSYAILCILDVPGGVPHYMRGMFKALTVAPAPTATANTPAAAMPVADNAIQLSDFIFHLAKPLTAGQHTIQVVTAPGQPHEVMIVQLEPGKTAQDYVRWTTSMKGPAPGHAIGGTAAASSGMQQVFTATFVPGRYALLCFVPDVKTGKAHYMEGHLQEITVE